MESGSPKKTIIARYRQATKTGSRYALLRAAARRRHPKCCLILRSALLRAWRRMGVPLALRVRDSAEEAPRHDEGRPSQHLQAWRSRPARGGLADWRGLGIA